MKTSEVLKELKITKSHFIQMRRTGRKGSQLLFPLNRGSQGRGMEAEFDPKNIAMLKVVLKKEKELRRLKKEIRDRFGISKGRAKKLRGR